MQRFHWILSYMRVRIGIWLNTSNSLCTLMLVVLNPDVWLLKLIELLFHNLNKNIPFSQQNHLLSMGSFFYLILMLGLGSFIKIVKFYVFFSSPSHWNQTALELLLVKVPSWVDPQRFTVQFRVLKHWLCLSEWVSDGTFCE